MTQVDPPHNMPDLFCLSPWRWNVLFSRPQHLMTRCARERRVFFVEEPVHADNVAPSLHITPCDGVLVLTPYLDTNDNPRNVDSQQRRLLTAFMRRQRIREYVLWYYTPMALTFTDHLAPLAIIYDDMDELASLTSAALEMRQRDGALMARASLVFTSSQSMYEVRRAAHRNVHNFPNSVDVDHFARARFGAHEPAAQARIPHPRIGFSGVIDERIDLALIAGIADARRDWQLVILGRITVDTRSLPQRSNIHYLGATSYQQLPGYLGGWDVALLPFTHTEATRFLSPAQTLEYLAAGAPVVSTSIRDVIRPYAQQGLVRIADDVPATIRACTAAMAEDGSARIRQADAFLRQTSWDGTWSRMRLLLDRAAEQDIDGRGTTNGAAAG